MNYTLIADLAASAEKPDKGMAKKVVYQDEQVKILIFRFAPGHELATHSAPVPVSILIQAGEGRLTVGEEAVDAKAGTFAHLSKGVPHALVARTDMVVLLQMYLSAS